MQRSLLFGIVGLIAGLAIGFFAANNINRNAMNSVVSAAQPQPAGPLIGGQTQGAPSGGMQPEVAAALDKAKNEPDNIEAQLKAAGMFARISNFDKAKEYIDKAAKVAPATFDGTVTIANAYFDAKQFDLARNFYEKALAIKPDDKDARTDLGSTYIEQPQPDFDKAIAVFNESLKTNPNYEPTLFNLTIAYYRKGDLDNAKKTIARLEEANPKSDLISQLKQRIAAN